MLGYGSFETSLPIGDDVQIGGTIFCDNSTVCTIGNLVWNDTNRNGVQDSNEPGVANATVLLQRPWLDRVLARMVTDANGRCTFSSVHRAVCYRHVNVVLVMGKHSPLAHCKFSKSLQGRDVEVDSNAWHQGIFALATLKHAPNFSESNLSVDFGVYR